MYLLPLPNSTAARRLGFVGLLGLSIGLTLSACAPSPLYRSARVPTTPGNVPRDTNGNPVWSKLPPRPMTEPGVSH